MGRIDHDHPTSFGNADVFAKLRALDGKAQLRPPAPDASGGAGRGDEVLSLLGLSSRELTPKVRVTVRQLVEEIVGLRKQLGATRARLAELERLANEDALTPVGNRRAFVRHLAWTIDYVGRYRTSSSLLYFDLNDLKAINDRYGHGAGDAVLIHVARTLRTHTRSSDVVGRLGGDEFGVLLSHADAAAARLKAEALAAALADPGLGWEGHLIPVGVAYGTHCLVAGEDPQDALAAADRAMYRQKRRRTVAASRELCEAGATPLRR